MLSETYTCFQLVQLAENVCLRGFVQIHARSLKLFLNKNVLIPGDCIDTYPRRNDLSVCQWYGVKVTEREIFFKYSHAIYNIVEKLD
jgi:hypothetical protein